MFKYALRINICPNWEINPEYSSILLKPQTLVICISSYKIPYAHSNMNSNS